MPIKTEELNRRLIHVAGTGYPLLYILDREFSVGLVDWPVLQAFVLVSMSLALGLEGLRLSGILDMAIYDDLTREYEEDHVAGYALYLIGMGIAVLAFEPRVALPAILMLTVGDPISGLLSSGDLAKQTWVLFAMFGICLLLAAPFVKPPVAIVGAGVATVADGVKPVLFTYVIDDNLTIPIGAGGAMALTLAVL